MIVIDIVMATYNGEEFIEEQICSIQKQTFTNWNLYISDDRSTDNTISIINDLILSDDRIKLVNVNRQGGVVKNFEKALQFSNSDYIIFTDQDDIWPKNRLQELLDLALSLNASNKNRPFMLFTDMELINENGLVVSDSYYKSNNCDPLENMNFGKLLWKSSVYGCTTMINKELLTISLPFPDNIPMHDHWLALNALSHANLNYRPIKSVKYRQHRKNVVGGLSKGFIDKAKNFKSNMFKIFKAVPKIKAMHSAFGVNRSRKDSLLFAVKFILPNAFKGNKKMYSFLMFIGFVIT